MFPNASTQAPAIAQRRKEARLRDKNPERFLCAFAWDISPSTGALDLGLPLRYQPADSLSWTAYWQFKARRTRMSRTLFWTGFLLWSLLSGCTGLGHRPEALVHVEYEQPNPVGGSSTAFVQAELRGAASEGKPPPPPGPDAKPIHAETQFHDKTSATPGNLPNLDILPQLGGMKTPGTNTSPAVGGKK